MEKVVWNLRLLQAILLLLLALWLAESAQGLSEEGQALLQFKNNITDASKWLANWMATDLLPCNWTGVTCTGNSVTAINLSNFNISGQVPEGVLGQLRNLTTLDLGNTNLGGIFPLDLLNCSNLVSLNLSYTYMEGPLPTRISQLTKLQTLDLSYSSFVGPVPDAFGDLLGLKLLNLKAANFSGVLPSSLGNLTNLTEIHLGLANFTPAAMPSWFANLTNLKVLDLSSSNFSKGPFPEWVQVLHSLQILDLAACNLTGSIPEFLGGLTTLQTLWLNQNLLNESIPENFTNLTELVSLDLSQNQLTGSIPLGLMELEKLEAIVLFANQLSGEVPGDIGNLRVLSQIDVSQNQLSGTIPLSMTNLTKLSILHLWQNSFSGIIPPGMANLQALTEFVLFENHFTGTVPGNLGKVCNLTRFDVSTNLLSGPVPVHLCDGQQLTQLIFFNNMFSGTIPDVYGNCRSLTRVRFEINELSGPIPDGLWGAPRMQIFTAHSNMLNRSILPSIGCALNLAILDISSNWFTGPIPQEIGNLVMMQSLSASGNNLLGTIPRQLSNLSQLNDLDLSQNSFTDQIPTALGNCTQLKTLNLSMNFLTGPIPSELGELSSLAILDLSHNALTGEVPSVLSRLPLENLDVSYNNLSGVLPLGLLTVTDAEGNPDLCDVASNCEAGMQQTNSEINGPLVSAVVGTFVAAMIILIMGSCCFYQRYTIFNEQHKGLVQSNSWHLTSFHKNTLTEYEIAESCNDPDNIIGSGGSGKVYKAVLGNGQPVAVKKLGWGETKGEALHDHGFKAEVETLGKIRHRNIVKLLCCCSNNESNLLVYEYMPNGSLGDILRSTKGGTLDWAMRYKVALGAAQGLEYLHHDCLPQIVHRDMKSNNVLLDADYEAHVADFGLARVLETTTVTTRKGESMSTVAGSYGYIAPEYAYTINVDEKSDIYSFGVVLLELITGKRPIEPAFGEGIDLVKWVMNKIQSTKGLYEVLDARLGHASHDDMILLLRVAILCLSLHPRSRPPMREVVQLLIEAKPKSCRQELNTKTNVSGSIWPPDTTNTNTKNSIADQDDERNETNATTDNDDNNNKTLFLRHPTSLDCKNKTKSRFSHGCDVYVISAVLVMVGIKTSDEQSKLSGKSADCNQTRGRRGQGQG